MITEKIKQNKNMIILYTLILSAFFGNNVYLDMLITVSYILLIVMSTEKEMFLIYILISFFEESLTNELMRRCCFKNINSINFN